MLMPSAPAVEVLAGEAQTADSAEPASVLLRAVASGVPVRMAVLYRVIGTGQFEPEVDG